MRKMKKFLAATLVSAMVLSMAVPAVAATGEPASNTQTAMDTESWTKTAEELSKKQKAYDDAELALKTAKQALAALEASAPSTPAPTETDLRKLNDDAKKAVDGLNGYRQQAAAKLAEAVKAEEKVAPAKKAASDAKDTYDKLEAAYKKNEADPNYDRTQLAKDEIALNEANAEANRTNKAYLDAVAASDKASDDAAAYQAEVDRIIDTTAIAVGAYDAAKALSDANGNYNAAIKQKQAEVDAAQTARDEALRALNVAKEAERAARAKLDSARQDVAAANYEKALLKEQMAAETEAETAEALNSAKAELEEVQNRIKQYLADIDAYYTAVGLLDDAEEAVKNAAADRVIAEAELATADYLLEVANTADANVNNVISQFEKKLDYYLTQDAYKTSASISEYVKARKNVEAAKAELTTMTNQYPKDVTAVDRNAWALYANCEDNLARAKEAYEEALIDVRNAKKNLDAAFDKYQTAVKALYETGEATMTTVDAEGTEDVEEVTYTYADGTVVPVFKPVAVDAEGNTIYLDKYEGMWVEFVSIEDYDIVGVIEDGENAGKPEFGLVEETVPATDANNKILTYQPNKLDTERNREDDTVNSAYRNSSNVLRIGNGQYVYADKAGNTITNKEEPTQPIPVEIYDNRYVSYPSGDLVEYDPLSGESLYCIIVPAVTNPYDGAATAVHTYDPERVDLNGVSETWLTKAVGDTMRIPTKKDVPWVAVAPYAQEIIANAKVAYFEDIHDKAVDAHNRAKAALDDAIAEYEYFFGHKPGEQNEATKQIVGSFVDVPADEWFAPFIADVVDKGLMKGYADGKHFGTYDQLQRQDFVVILWRMAGSPVVNYPYTYKDVEKGSYYEDAVRWAASVGVANGYNADEFGVGKNITREDYTLMLHRYYGYPTQVAEISSFLDASKVSGYAEKAVKWAVSVGAINGKENGTIIDPQAPIARCEAAKILSKVTDWTI